MPTAAYASRGLIFGLLATFLLVAPAAQAVQTYTYTGNPFTTANTPFTTDDFVKITFSVDALLPTDSTVEIRLLIPGSFDRSFAGYVADSLTMTAGSFAFTVADTETGGQSRLHVVTDSSGSIVRWGGIIDTGGSTRDAIGSCNVSPSSFGFCGSSNTADQVDLAPVNNGLENGFLTNNAGSWSVVPEPSTVSLLALGLAGIAVVGRRRAN